VGTLASLVRFARHAAGRRDLRIVETTERRLVLASALTTIVFDKASGEIGKRGKREASFAEVMGVELRRPSACDERPVWFVAMVLADGRRLDIGPVTDEVDASLVAAHIARTIDRPVSVM
jgi:hypothetical protein